MGVEGEWWWWRRSLAFVNEISCTSVYCQSIPILNSNIYTLPSTLEKQSFQLNMWKELSDKILWLDFFFNPNLEVQKLRLKTLKKSGTRYIAFSNGAIKNDKSCHMLKQSETCSCVFCKKKIARRPRHVISFNDIFSVTWNKRICKELNNLENEFNKEWWLQLLGVPMQLRKNPILQLQRHNLSTTYRSRNVCHREKAIARTCIQTKKCPKHLSVVLASDFRPIKTYNFSS